MFIIYNSFAIAVTQRRSEIGILRALGATRRQIRWLFLGESAVTGLVGSLGGAAVRPPDRARHRGVDRHADRRRLRRRAARRRARRRARRCSALALVIGIGTSIVAAADSGAQRGARRSGAGAAEGQVSGAVGRREPAARAIAARRCCGARLDRLSALVGGSRLGLSTSATCSRSLVALLLGPLLSLGARAAIRPVLKWLRPVEGALAADSLIQAPRRTSASVAALMLSLALVVAFAGMARASYDSIIDWMETALNPDLFVMPSQNIVIRTLRFPPAMAPELAAMPGVERVQMVRDARIVFRKTPVMVVAVEVDSIARDRAAPPVAGDADEMYRETAAGRGPDGVGQPRAAAASDARRDARDSGAERRRSACRSSASSSTTPISRARS